MMPAMVAVQATAAPMTFRLSFGMGEKEPSRFDGTIRVDAGRVVSLEGWHFDGDDEILEGNRWRLSTRLPPTPQFRPDEIARGQQPPPPQVYPNGVLVTLDAPLHAQVQVETAAGNFSFRVGDVTYGTPLRVLNGRGRVERVPTVTRLTGDGTHEDHASIATDADGTMWLAYTSYAAQRNGDAVFVRTGREGEWDEGTMVSDYGDHFQTAVVPLGNREAWVFFSRHASLDEGANWDVYAVRVKASSPPTVGQPERVSTAAGPDIYVAACSDKQGGAWVVWQGSEDQKQFDIFARRWTPQRGWEQVQKISESKANDWEPAVVATSDGHVFVGWDSYDKGNYDICLREGKRGKWGRVQFVTDSPAFEAHVFLNVDAQGRLWLAWDQAGALWGKDSAFNPDNAFDFKNFGTRLHAGRRPRLACLTDKGLQQPQVDLVESLPPGMRQMNEYPQVHFDRHGRLWVFYRFPDRKRQAPGGGAMRTWWENAAACWDGDRWLTNIWLPHTVNRQDMRISVAPSGEGFVCAWTSDERPWRNPAPQFNNVYVAAVGLPEEGGGLPTLMAYQPPTLEQPPNGHPNEAQDVARRKAATVKVNGEMLRLVCGDTHRHTDISADGGGDGSQYDMYRYALDAVALDWIAIGDHDNGFPLPPLSEDYAYAPGQQFTWWQTQKACDLFYLKNVFLPMFGYERSNAWPYGHRNVMNWKRGYQVVPRIMEQVREGNRTRQVLSPRDLQNLYAELRKSGGVAFEHTSGTNTMGTDWRDVKGNEDVEPVVELYQGCRTNYEYVGAPRAATADKVALQTGGFAPEGYVWEAWKQGLRLGVIASSDHGSTHTSYASAWVRADNFGRAELVRAFKLRRTFAATDNIVLWVKAETKQREYFMGEEFETQELPRLRVHVEGTAPIKQVHVIRDFAFVHTQSPNKPNVEFTYRDTDLTPGTHLYYIRVEQEDGQLAWASPLWVNYRP
ncbi:MAG: DUF3604 domain-containing protein [Abditibacteriales bacterium]|nr:DUF3604 domain-containing protein [Abditibacteriales bacterium]